MLNTIATTLVPVAFVMFLGYWAGYREIFGATDRTQLTKLVLTWLLPPLLIAGMLKTPRADLMDYRIPLLFVVGLLLPYLVVLLGCRYVLKWDLSTSTLRTDLLIFPDMVFMGVPILGQLFGPSSLYPILIANLVPVLFILPITNVIVLVDTGAIKMWMARLYPTYAPLTCLVSNGLSTMAFALPGALAARLAKPHARVLAAMGDGAFLMNSQEIETAVREEIPLVALVWVDDAYGLIKWKMDLEMGHHRHVDFGNPDFVKYADSFGARGYRIEAAADLLPTLRKALDDEGVSVIACPADYSENMKLTARLGALTDPL